MAPAQKREQILANLTSTSVATTIKGCQATPGCQLALTRHVSDKHPTLAAVPDKGTGHAHPSSVRPIHNGTGHSPQLAPPPGPIHKRMGNSPPRPIHKEKAFSLDKTFGVDTSRCLATQHQTCPRHANDGCFVSYDTHHSDERDQAEVYPSLASAQQQTAYPTEARPDQKKRDKDRKDAKHHSTRREEFIEDHRDDVNDIHYHILPDSEDDNLP